MKKEFTMQKRDFQQMFNAVACAVGTDKIHQSIYNRIAVYVEGDGFAMVATDGHRAHFLGTIPLDGFRGVKPSLILDSAKTKRYLKQLKASDIVDPREIFSACSKGTDLDYPPVFDKALYKAEQDREMYEAQALVSQKINVKHLGDLAKFPLEGMVYFNTGDAQEPFFAHGNDAELGVCCYAVIMPIAR